MDNYLKILSDKIANNTATLKDYKQYEKILLDYGLEIEDIHKFLKQANFSNWKDFVEARKDKEREVMIETSIIGGLASLGIGVLLYSLFNNK